MDRVRKRFCSWLGLLALSLARCGARGEPSPERVPLPQTLVRGVQYRDARVLTLSGQATQHGRHSDATVEAFSYLRREGAAVGAPTTPIRAENLFRLAFDVRGECCRLEALELLPCGVNEWKTEAYDGKLVGEVGDGERRPSVLIVSDGERVWTHWPWTSRGEISHFPSRARVGDQLMRMLTRKFESASRAGDTLARLKEVRVLGSETISGISCWKLSGTPPEVAGGLQCRVTAWVATDHGYSIMRWEFAARGETSGKLFSQRDVISVLALKQIDDELWLPSDTTANMYQYGTETDSAWRETKHCVFDDLRVNTDLDAGVFAPVRFPLGTWVDDLTTHGSAVVGNADFLWQKLKTGHLPIPEYDGELARADALPQLGPPEGDR